MTRNDVISKIKANIDELTPFSETDVVLDGDILVKPINRYIDELLNDVTDSVRLVAPINKISKKEFNSSIHPKELISGISYHELILPADFLRIAMISLNTWYRPVILATPRESEEYRLLRNPHTSSGSAKPSVVVVEDVLEIYGSGTTLVDSLYIHKEYFSDTDLEVDELVLNAICWRCAIDVLSVMERYDAQKKAMEFYTESLQKLGL